MATVRAYIGIGSNIDGPVPRVRTGIEALRKLGNVSAVSSLYVTSPWGRSDQPDFINAVIQLDTELSARELLAGLKQLEIDLGRQESERWGPRRIDFDILTYGNQEFDEGDLVIPHRRLYQRAFVLVPLAEVASEFTSARDALDESERQGVRLLEIGK
jgi:2-amino-4-hydroxy-6-hydroxymethyldihydropteridine diphosphokinase